MVITHHGLACVRLQFGDMVIASNPIGKNSEIKSTRFGADIVFSSLNDEAFNGFDSIATGNKDPFIVDGPGEYEFSDIFIKGFPSLGPNNKINTIYIFNFEGMRICHLGALAGNDLSADTLEEISAADILFSPIGDLDSIEPAQASKLVSSLEPAIIIPILTGTGKKDYLSSFLKNMGIDQVSALDKLSLKKKDLEGKQAEVIPLDYSR
jgi:hypothetical protein